MSEILHGTLVARRFPQGWRGVLLRGPSGAGKSDLALRALAGGFRLVADDRVVVWRSGARAFGRAPQPLCGLAEVRGVGVGPTPFLDLAPLSLVVDLREGERVPSPAHADVAGVAVPHLELGPFGESGAERLARALELHGLR